MDRVFICYSRKDSEFVDAFVHDLNMAGVNTWYDVNDIPRDKAANSQSWRRAVDRALRECGFMIVVLSPDSVASEEVEAEWNYFLKQKRPLFPIIYRTCDVPYRLDALNWIDFRYNYDQAFNSLLELLPYSASYPPVQPPPINPTYDDFQPTEDEPPARKGSGWLGIPMLTWIMGGGAALVLLVVFLLIVNSWRNGDVGDGTPTATTEGAPTPTTDPTLDVGVPTDPPTLSVTETPTPTDEPTPTEAVVATPAGGGTGKIAFESNRDGNFEIYVMDADGQNVSNLTNNPANDTSPVWSPDGSRIAFVSDRDGNTEIYVMDVNEGTVSNRTNNSAPDYSPTWSPDGLSIAFVSDRGVSPNVYVMAADGSNPSRLTSTDGLQSEIMPAWKPDGTQIAFVLEPEGNRDVYVIPAGVTEGAAPTNLTNNGAQDDMPAWSADSAALAFVADQDGNNEIYRMAADGSGLARLTDDPASDIAPAWSPDGSLIAFSSERDGNYEIYVMSAADGAGPTRLTTSELMDSAPSWQPAPISAEPTSSPQLALFFDFASYLLPSD